MNATQVAQLGIVNDHKQVFPAFTSLTITIRDLGTLLLADGGDPLAIPGTYHHRYDWLERRIETGNVVLRTAR